VSEKRPVSFSRKGSDYVNLRSLFLIFVVMVMMCGSASAATNDYIFYLSCNEGSGSTAYDATGNHNATLGAGVSWVDGVSGGGLLIDRDSDSLLTIADDNELDMFNSEFGIAFYIRPYEDYDTSALAKTLFLKRTATYSTDGWASTINRYGGKGIQFTMSNATGEQDMESSSLSGLWTNDTGYWIYINFDGSTTEFYRDSTAYGTTSYTRTGDYPNNNTVDLKLFSDFYGIVDEIYLFDHTLTSDDRTAIYIEEEVPEVEYYVSTTGSDDTGDGSISTPWQTIPYALTQISATDTLWIRGGTYTNQSINLQTNGLSGTSADHTIISGYPGETVILNGNSTIRGVQANLQSYTEIKNITFNDYQYGLTYADSEGNVIENVKIIDCFEGILITATSTGDKNFTISDTVLTNITEHGIQIKDASVSGETYNIDISDSIITNAGHNGIDVFGNVTLCDFDNVTVQFTGGYTDADVGIYFHNGVNRLNSLRNSTISGIPRAIEFYDADSIIIYNNTITGASGANANAFRFTGGNLYSRMTENITILDNTIIDSNCSYKFVDGGFSLLFSDITFSGNTHQNVSTNWLHYDGDYSNVVLQDEIFNNFTFNWNSYSVTGEVIKYVNSNDTAIYSDGSNTYTDEGDYTRLWIESDVTDLWVASATYWTPTVGNHYLNVPEQWTWNAGSWDVTFVGTYTEAQTEVTGVEIRP
jgi:hypothetical protein